MSTHLLVKCDGTFPPPHPGPCTAFRAVPLVDDLGVLGRELLAAGWSMNHDGQLCPAHTRRSHDAATTSTRQGP